MQKQNPRKRRILIVEDEEGISELLKDFFRVQGYDCDIAEDGIEAEELWKKGKYQLILTDIIFFQSGGIDLIKTIRYKDKTTPILAMTGYGPEICKEAMEAGANEFLLKPFTLTQMKKKIGRYIHGEKP